MRLWFKLIRPKIEVTRSLPLRKILGKWSLPISKQVCLKDETTFYFLNLKGSLANHGWDDPKVNKLWRYNQHYFNDLNAIDSKKRKSWHVKLLKLWIKENAPTTGSGWEPYLTDCKLDKMAIF